MFTKTKMVLLLLFFASQSFATGSQSENRPSGASYETYANLIAKKKNKRKGKATKRNYKKDADFEWSRSAPRHSVETNVFGIVVGVLNADYHIPYGGDRSTIGITGYYYGLSGIVSGVGVGGLYTYYIDQLYDGIFVTGGVTFSSLSVSDTSASGISVLGLGGYRYNFNEDFSVSGGLGLQYFTFAGSLANFNAIGYSVLIKLGMYLN